jgi:adenine-specific DNA-methyltransferase
VDGDSRPAIKRFISEVTDTIPATTVWRYDEVGHNDEAKKESKALFGDGLFGTPKPERLMLRIIELATNPGDLILDSFAGSGTTGAVAHKMGRRWIMVELGEHCHTHIIPRLQKVIDGEDKGGISEAVNWQGGGGFRYYKLAPSLLRQDAYGQWIINKEYNAEMLAQALCKLEGFTYAPSDEHYWMHGSSTESDFIYVTTQTLNAEQLQALSDEVGEGRSLLVCCGAFRGAAERFPNLTLKKIPKMVLQKCEWGHDDYSLKVENLPKAEHSPSTGSGRTVEGNGEGKSKGDKNANPAQAGLFAGDEQ